MNKLEIYLKEYPKLLALASSRLPCSDDSHDILQKVYIYLNNKKDETFVDEEHVRRWMTWLTKNECRSHFRKNKKYIQIDDEEMNNKIHESLSPLECLVNSDLKSNLLDRLPAALMSLSPLQRKAVKLYYFENKDRHEICKALKSTSGAVSSALSKSVKTLQKYFKKSELSLK